MSRKDEFLESQKVLRLATISPDGTPHLVPVWYRLAGEKIQIGTNTATAKARNVRSNSRVSFCVDTGVNAPDIYGIMGQGSAALILDSHKVKSIAKKILSRYFDSLDSKSARELLAETNCIIEITPDRLTVWEY